MDHFLIRTAHQTVQAIHQEQEVVMLDTTHTLLYYLVSFLILALVAFLYLKHYACEKYSIPVLLYADEMFYLNLTMVVILGGVGLFAVIDKCWDEVIWRYYGMVNLLFAAYIIVYNKGFQYALILATLLLGGLSYCCYWFFGFLAKDINGIIVLTLVGMVLAWALVWFVVVLGQVLVYEVGINKRPQTYCFFVTVVLVLFVGIYWLRVMGVSWLYLIGYLFSGSAHVGFMFFRSMTHAFW